MNKIKLFLFFLCGMNYFLSLGQNIRNDTMIITSHYGAFQKLFFKEWRMNGVRDSVVFYDNGKVVNAKIIGIEDTSLFDFSFFMEEVKEKFNINYSGAKIVGVFLSPEYSIKNVDILNEINEDEKDALMQFIQHDVEWEKCFLESGNSYYYCLIPVPSGYVLKYKESLRLSKSSSNE